MSDTRYVVGFQFDADEHSVLLLRKLHPTWQRGKCNGVGGHVEEGESFYEAMVREGLEETGQTLEWEMFAQLRGDGWVMGCFRGNDSGLVTWGQNDVGEGLERWLVQNVVDGMSVTTIPNLRWLVPMALSRGRHDWPYHITEKAASTGETE